MTGIQYTSPSSDGLYRGLLFDVMPLRDSIVTADGNELARAGVQNVNVGTAGRAPLCIETRKMTVLIIHHISVSIVDEQGCVHTSPLITGSLEETSCSRAICSPSLAGYVGSSSRIAPLNHAYLCLNVTDGVVRPKIIPFTSTRPGTTYEGDGYRENTHHTGGLFQHSEVFPASLMSDTSYLGTRSMTQSSIKGHMPSYIDLGDYDQQCQHCGCLFWYSERIRNNNYGRRVEYHLCCEGGKIYMPPTPDPPLYIYDTRAEVSNRMRNFGGREEDTLNPDIVEVNHGCSQPAATHDPPQRRQRLEKVASWWHAWRCGVGEMVVMKVGYAVAVMAAVSCGGCWPENGAGGVVDRMKMVERMV
ncbi:hypothetical protein Tco_1227326 [Tanacetum coccineum]